MENSDQRVDVVVVGAGIVGSLAAWRSIQRGLSVRWFDPDPGNGASYAAAGMLAPTFEAAFGEHELMALNVESARLWPSLASEIERESGMSVDLRAEGSLSIAFDSGDFDEAKRLHQLHHEWGLDSELLSSAEVRQRLPLAGTHVAGGLWAAHDHQVDPRRVIQALRLACENRGLRVERRRVAGLLTQGPRAGSAVGLAVGSQRVNGIRLTDGHTVLADRVILAAGWESASLVGEFTDTHIPTRSVKGEVLRLNHSATPWLDTRFTVRGLVQGRPVYIVPRENGEIVIGATTNELPDDRAATAGGVFALLRDARAIIPGLDEAEFVEATARSRPGSPDNLPLIGSIAGGTLLVATGHYRHGILLAAVTSGLIERMLGGRELPDYASACIPTRFAKAQQIPTIHSREVTE